jgi:trk system potassium uptake protein TrkA
MEVARGYALVKAPVPSMIQGKPLGETALRRTHGVTIAAYQHGEEPWQNADNATVLQPGDTILVLGPTAKAESFAQLL